MAFPPGILTDFSGSPDTLRYVEMKLPTTSQQRAGHEFVRPELALGISKQNIRKMIICWMDNQHMAMWRGLITQRRARKFISGPSPNAKTRLLTFNRTQCSTFTDLLTGRNTHRRHLYVMGLTYSPLCRKCGAQEETSANVLSVTPWLHSDTPISAFSWAQTMLKV